VKRQSLVIKPSRLAADEVVRVYGSNCAICNQPIDLTLKRTSSMGLTVDHWIPLSKGGSDEMSNLRPAHWTCNRKKSDKLPKEVNA
jgi:5-methylcytosine-specific restriction endonuclease McrA